MAHLIDRRTHSYATRDNAVKGLEKALLRIGRTFSDTRWLISIRDDGRFVPVVLATGNDVSNLIPLAHIGITVIG